MSLRADQQTVLKASHTSCCLAQQLQAWCSFDLPGKQMRWQMMTGLMHALQ